MSLIADTVKAWRTQQARAELSAIAATFEEWADLAKRLGVLDGGMYYQRAADYVMERLGQL